MLRKTSLKKKILKVAINIKYPWIKRYLKATSSKAKEIDHDKTSNEITIKINWEKEVLTITKMPYNKKSNLIIKQLAWEV